MLALPTFYAIYISTALDILRYMHKICDKE